MISLTTKFASGSGGGGEISGAGLSVNTKGSGLTAVSKVGDGVLVCGGGDSCFGGVKMGLGGIWTWLLAYLEWELGCSTGCLR